MQPVTIVSYGHLPFVLPPNFTFFSIAQQEFPAEKWSNGVIDFLNILPDKWFIWFLDDYWLIRHADNPGIGTIYEYAQSVPNLLRFDLTDDRQYAGQMRDYAMYGNYDIITTPHDSPYQFSLQAALWNKDQLLKILQPNKSPWEAELHTQVPETMTVLGTRQKLVRYVNAWGTGSKGLNTTGIPKEQLDFMRMNGWLNVPS